MRIFRTLLIAAVNAIKEFLSFATDNGESQVGDTIKLNDGMATSNYDWSAYPSDTTVIGNYTATGTVEKIKEVNGETVYVTNEPEQDNKDVSIKAGEVYYAYTNENDNTDSVYTTDNPISKGEFILQNLTNSGCTIDNNLAYGSSNNKIIVNNISNLNTYNSWSFNTKFVYNGGGGGTYGQQVLGVGSGHGIRLGTLSDNKLFCCLSSQDGSWTIAGDGTYLNKTLTVWNTYYLQFGYDGTQYYCKCEETPITQETSPIWTLTSPLKVNTSSNLWLLNYHYSPSSDWFTGPIYLDETYFILDDDIVNFGHFTNPSTLYENTGTNEFVPTALDPQPSFTIQNIGLINATEEGTLTNNNGVYSGFGNSNYINAGKSLKSTNNSVYEVEFTTGNDITGLQPILHCEYLFSIELYNGTLNTWNREESSFVGTVSVDTNTTYCSKIEINGNSKAFYYKKATDTNYTLLWSGTDTGMDVSADYNLTIGRSSKLNDTAYFNGSINMKNTSVTIDGQKTNFYNTESGIKIGNNLYERNSTKDDVKNISGLTVDIETIDNTTINSITIQSEQTATIETSANVTTANNGVAITDGSRHSFNITVPSTKVAYIESAGISYQASDMPIDVYNGRGVGIAIKDSANSQTSYYINSWIVNKNYDLHYQQITFTTNVENPTIIFKINNNVIESPYYGYYGDNYTYTISKKGYEDYNGSGKISYSSKNGNIINIEANLTPSSNSIDVTGWTYSVDNGVVTLLDGPVDASGELTFPNIEEE